MNNIISISLLIVIVVIFVFFGIFLHRKRKKSTKAKDFFKKKLSLLEENDVETVNDIRGNNDKNSQELEFKQNRVFILENDKYRQVYQELLELFKNREPNNDVPIEDQGVDEDTDENEYVTLKEFSHIFGLELKTVKNFLFEEGLIENRYGVIFLTDGGIKLGGKYDKEDIQIVIKWKKANLSNIIKKDNNGNNTWSIFNYSDVLRGYLENFWSTILGILFFFFFLFLIFGR